MGALSGGTNYKAASSPRGRALKGVPSAIYRAHGNLYGASRQLSAISHQLSGSTFQDKLRQPYMLIRAGGQRFVGFPVRETGKHLSRRSRLAEKYAKHPIKAFDL